MSEGSSEIAPTKAPDALIGRTIAGKFVIERLLGEGAMGAVYRAQQTALERAVAIKVMRGAVAADPTYAARFHLEAKAASRLDHPNVIRILDYGQEPDGLLYIAMELLECRDLFGVLTEDWPLPHARIVDILSQTLSALAEAHDAGVMHRDLKPENIMVLARKDDDGTSGRTDLVKVCDFGIAKMVESPSDADRRGDASGASQARRLTTAGLVVGTPEYMSPEQARGETYDARSDVYAVGVILYQLLTQRLPFQGKTPIEVVFKAMHEAPPPLDALGPTSAPGLDAVCLKAMQKEPADRFQSAREMRAALRAAAVTDPKSAPRANSAMATAPTLPEVPTTSRLRSPQSRTRTMTWLGALTVGGVAVALVAGRHAPAATLVEQRPAPSGPAGSSLSAASMMAPSAIDTPLPSAGPASTPTSPSAPPQPLVRSERRTGREPRRTAGLHAAASDLSPSPGATADPSASAPTSLATTAVRAPDPSVLSSPPAPAAQEVSPAPAAAPLAPAPPAPAPAPGPRLDPATARVDLGFVKSNNAAATSVDVGHALGPLMTKFTACYRAALVPIAQAGGAGGDVGTLHLESDDAGYVTVARVTGDVPSAAARCIEAASRGAHIQVDTGTADADATLRFTPR